MSLPFHLAGTEASGLAPDEPIAQFEIGDYRNFVYLVLDPEHREAALVDPQLDLTGPLAALEKNNFKLAAILLTHTHHDHIAGLPELVRTHAQVPIYLHESDLHRLKPDFRSAKIKTLTDGECFYIGQTQVEAMHTPGHSAGEICYFIASRLGRPPYLLTGDTVFIRDCGRTDLPTGSNREMFASLQRIKKLPSNTVILPGHHYALECASTLERELRDSAPLRCASIAELEALP